MPHRALHFFCLSPSPLPLTKSFFVKFLEVTKEKRIFAARVDKEECTTFLDCWIYNLKHMETLEKMPFEAQHKIFKRLAEIADSKSLTKEEQEKYDNSMMVMWNNYAVYKHAEEKGIKKIALKLLAPNYPLVQKVKKRKPTRRKKNAWRACVYGCTT